MSKWEMSEHVWIKTAEQPPTEADGWGENKLALTKLNIHEEYRQACVGYGSVANWPHRYPYWSHIIPPAEPFRITGPGWYVDTNDNSYKFCGLSQHDDGCWLLREKYMYHFKANGTPFEGTGVNLIYGPCATREEAEAAR